MVLSANQILKFINNPSNSNIEKWKEDYKTLSVYIEGGDVSLELEKIKNYENEEQRKLRQKVARSTKDKVSNLLNPITKVFNANGGSVDFKNLENSRLEEFKTIIKKLPEGISVRNWMETYWKRAFVSDPNGVILIETDEDGNAYPTYKCISKIVDYRVEWNKFEYLILEYKKATINKKEVQIYRVYDDEKDALYYVNGDKLIAYKDDVDEHSYINTLKEVPAIVCGGIPDINTGGQLTFINKIDESLREYLRASSVHTIYKFLHLFPKFWQYAMKCTRCNGTGQVIDESSIDNPKKKKKCPSCNGKRLKTQTDVSDGIFLPLPKDGQPVLGGNVAGYIDTPSGVWEQQNEDLKDMLREMEYTIWGAYLNERPDEGNERTATEAFINVQPINEKLHNISRCAENKESQILTMMAHMMYGDDEIEVSSRYGKRFVIESPDALWKKYIDAKEKKAPIATLDYHYEQYLMSEFQNDPMMMSMRKKMLSIEPYAHYKVEDLSAIVSKETLAQKIVFSSWLLTDIDWSKDIKALKNEFNTFFQDNKPELIQNQNQNENA